ncbi:unnamed protein product [Cercopithifilaria johnstoni]|uniref:Uncharacterized protein n=1 Tax=Cercopithifilaria johnstoni TaxID=2874296 RepID=A0A8J2MVE2_9BILA|nr:unnamed protein product [Cercopithifilaria johnstoni]
MGCQSSKQSENVKTKKSKLSKLDVNENANAAPNVRLPNSSDSKKSTCDILMKSKRKSYNEKRLLDSIASQPVIEKLQLQRSNKEIPVEKVTFSSEEPNDEVGNSAPEPVVIRSADLKRRRIVSRSMEPNEEVISNWNQSKRNKLHVHESNFICMNDNNKGHEQLDEKLNKKYKLNNGKQLQIRTKTKRSRADPEDDTLYEVPLKMPEFDLIPSRSGDSVA